MKGGIRTVEINLIFKIAAVGILITILGQVLKHSGREEHAFLISLAGLILVLSWIVPYIYELFEMIQKSEFLGIQLPFSTMNLFWLSILLCWNIQIFSNSINLNVLLQLFSWLLCKSMLWSSRLNINNCLQTNKIFLFSIL